MFFSEEKNQKTFIPALAAILRPIPQAFGASILEAAGE
jgi:hypothetical protein